MKQLNEGRAMKSKAKKRSLVVGVALLASVMGATAAHAGWGIYYKTTQYGMWIYGGMALTEDTCYTRCNTDYSDEYACKCVEE